MWFVQANDTGLTAAGPFDYKEEAYAWAMAQYKHDKGTLFCLAHLDGSPLEPTAIVKEVTPELLDLQRSGDMVLVTLPDKSVAVYTL